ncbi:MAG TPA: NUDIX domain-containing protein [Anaerolineales bacterium]|nr:NUDIX domain-containing protein [Anaerolineales bacterium]
MNQIRPIAICIFRNHDRILVFEGVDPSNKEIFYRPLGGGIEFGEHSEDTIRREILEEINAEVNDLRYLGTLENMFTFDGRSGHEIVQVYDGVLKESELYEQAVIVGHEAEIDESFNVYWKDLNDFRKGKSILYPDGLLELLIAR